ncbi:MAG: thioredoxin [Peptococcaceae bacterium]|nr:thioredoxin [Peptococcaceae bacterium]
MTEVKQVTGAELEELVASGKRVLADFFLDNCGPCKMQKVILKEMAKNAENLDIVTVNLGQSAEIAKNYEIGTVPYLILFEQGQVKERMLGMQQKAMLLEIINE